MPSVVEHVLAFQTPKRQFNCAIRGSTVLFENPHNENAILYNVEQTIKLDTFLYESSSMTQIRVNLAGGGGQVEKGQFQLNHSFILAFNFAMEEKNRGKVESQPPLEAELWSPNEKSDSVRFEKGGRKLKRDTLRQKKQQKALEGKYVPSDDLETDNVSNKQREDEAGSVGSQQGPAIMLKKTRTTLENATIVIPKCLSKPPYVGLVQSNRIVGTFGHGSAIFKRPIIQGSYFMEFTVREDTKKQKPTTYPSAVRVGVCLPTFDTAYPLGCGESIAYKSVDGSIVRQNECIGKAVPYTTGDVIGVCLRIRPLRKHPQPTEIDDGSILEFYKNGQLVFELRELKQVSYCIGASVYNYAQIHVSTRSEGIHSIKGAQQYFTCLTEQVPYQDLADSNLFKI